VLSGKQEGAASTAVGKVAAGSSSTPTPRRCVLDLVREPVERGDGSAHPWLRGPHRSGGRAGRIRRQSKLGVWNYTPADEAPLLAGQCYVNITVNNGGGGSAATVLLNAVVCSAGDAARPPGWMTATIDTTANTISYYPRTRLTGAVSAAHSMGTSTTARPRA
jgi:hypothetical protein